MKVAFLIILGSFLGTVLANDDLDDEELQKWEDYKVSQTHYQFFLYNPIDWPFA